MFLEQCDGKQLDLRRSPAFEELLKQPGNYLDLILRQVNYERLYDKLFGYDSTNVFLDCGGYAGLVSLYVAPRCGRVITIEPHPRNYSVLRELVDLYEPAKVLPLQIAVAAISGPICLYENTDNQTMPTTITYQNDLGSRLGFSGERVIVQGLTLRDIMIYNDISTIDILKMDIEGAEQEVIMAPSFAEVAKDIRKLYVEIHIIHSDYGRIFKRLSDLGFTIEEIPEPGPGTNMRCLIASR